MVVQFVAFPGVHRDPSSLDPWAAAVLASLLVTWVITAAVVGVIADLGLHVAVHTLFTDVVAVDPWGLSLELPDLGTPRWAAPAITAVAAVLLFRLRWSVLRTPGVCAVLGLAARLAGLPG